VRDALSGGWLIEPAELFRLYPEADRTVRGATDDVARNGHDAPEIAELRARLADAHETIADLRTRLDVATEQLGEALQQVRALTDQRVKSETVADLPAALGRRSWWRWGRPA
jgi:hypothetical protein